MTKWYKGRTLTHLVNEREEFEAAKLGQYYEVEVIDQPCVFDLSQVVEYHASKVIREGAYYGHPVVWVYGLHNSTMLLTTFDKFHQVMQDYENSKSGHHFTTFTGANKTEVDQPQ